MMELRRILLVDWYLFRVEQIDVSGMTALVAANGAGKSAIIDAVQTVLTGANMSVIRFNASAQNTSKSKRSIRDYCLGVVSLDEKGERSEPTRSHGYTYLVLGFVDLETGKATNIGVAFSANATRPDETLESQFISRGALVSKEDLLESLGEGELETRPWQAVRTLLRLNGQEVTDGFGSATQFVEEALHALSPAGFPLDARRFSKSFRNALVLKPVDNPTEFVRDYVLDTRPIQIAHLRTSIDLYRSLTKRIAELKAQSTSLGQIVRTVTKTNENERVLRRVEWEITRLAWEQFRRELKALKISLDELGKDLFLKHTEKVRTAAALSRLEAELQTVDLALKSTEEEQLAQMYEADQRAERVNRNLAIIPLATLNTTLANISTMVERRVLIGRDETVHAACETAAHHHSSAKTSGWSGALPEQWLSVAKALDDAVATIDIERLRVVQKAVASSAVAGEVQVHLIQERIDKINENLKRLNEGRSAIEHGTRSLIDALKSSGVEAEPLCDLVEVTDEKWRASAEAVLGRSREALVVEPSHANRALQIFRAGAENNFRNAEIINTTKTIGTRAADSGSLATVITTTNPHVRAFLDSRIGRLSMVETSDKVLASESSITPDRMMHSGRTVKRLARPEYLKLGRASIEETRRHLEQERATLLADLAEKARTAHRWIEDRKLIDDVLSALEAATKAGLTFTAIGSSIASCDQRIATLDKNIVDARRQRDPKLLKEQAALKSSLAVAKSDAQHADKAHGLSESAHQKVQWKYDDLRDNEAVKRRDSRRSTAKLLPRDVSSREEISQFLYYARKQLTEMLEQDIGLRSFEAQKLRDVRRPALQRELLSAVFKHCQEFQIVRPFADDETTAETVGPWATSEKLRLDNHELVQYDQECHTAQEEMTTAFRDDLLHRLHDAFEEIKDTLAELNRHLKDRQFHGRDFYWFRSSPAASHKDLIELVAESRRPDFQLPLFVQNSEASPEDTAITRAVRVIERLLTDQTSSTEEIQDPRLYFTFELDIRDKEGRIRSTLSSRTGTGSGGEGQLPFYIAIGASLAATYLNKRTEKMGMALAVFDEAFSRLDTKAICACSDFLKSLGLQPLLAAPDDKRHIFMEVADTVINLNRVGDQVFVHTEYLTERTRTLLAQADPHRKGFESFKAELLSAKSAVAATDRSEAAE